MNNFKFLTNCVCSDGESINDMVDHEEQVDVTRREFLKATDKEIRDDVEHNMLGYAKHHTQGLTISKDWHVNYSKSYYQGKPCYYITWSAIEWIFTEPKY
jgi:hypothetical protein